MQYAAIEPKRKPVLTKENSSIILFAGTLLSVVPLAIVMFDKYQQQLKRAWMQARQEGRRAAPQRLQEAGTLPSIPAPLPDSKGARTHTKMSTLAENVVFDLCAPMHVASPHLNYLPIQHHILCRHVQNSLCDQFSPLSTPNKYLDVHLMQDHHGDN